MSKSILPKKLHFTFNGKMEYEKEFTYIAYNRENDGAIEFVTVWSVKKDMCTGFDKDGNSVLCITSFQVVDGRKKKIFRGGGFDGEAEAKVGDSMHISWKLFVDGFEDDEPIGKIVTVNATAITLKIN